MDNSRKPMVHVNNENNLQDYKITTNSDRSQNFTNTWATLVLKALSLIIGCCLHELLIIFCFSSDYRRIFLIRGLLRNDDKRKAKSWKVLKTRKFLTKLNVWSYQSKNISNREINLWINKRIRDFWFTRLSYTLTKMRAKWGQLKFFYVFWKLSLKDVKTIR